MGSGWAACGARPSSCCATRAARSSPPGAPGWGWELCHGTLAFPRHHRPAFAFAPPPFVFARSYQSHEHLGAVENLLAIGAKLTHAYPNGFREVSGHVPTTDLLQPPGAVAEAVLDPYPRPYADGGPPTPRLAALLCARSATHASG